MNSALAGRIAYFLLRVVTGLLFFQVGSTKHLGWFGGMPGGGRPALLTQIGIGGVLEFYGGILIMLGLFTRPVAFLVSGEMAIAYFHGHAPNGFWPVLNGGHPAVLFCFVWLFFSAAGAGPWSVDALIKRETARAADPA